MKFNENKDYKKIYNQSKYNSKTKLKSIDSIDLIQIIINLEKATKKKISLEALNKLRELNLLQFIKKYL
jgi:acyl carrier protein